MLADVADNRPAEGGRALNRDAPKGHHASAHFRNAFQLHSRVSERNNVYGKYADKEHSQDRQMQGWHERSNHHAYAEKHRENHKVMMRDFVPACGIQTADAGADS